MGKKIDNAITAYKEKGIIYFVKHYISRFYLYFINGFSRCLFYFFPLKNTIVIESHNDFDCNGGAFYQYLLDNEYNKKYRIVWLIMNDAPEKLPYNVKSFDYYRPSLRKQYYLNTAKFMLCDDKYIQKNKRKQTCIYCTHGGVTFKNVHGLINVPDYFDYILSPSEWYDPYLCANYSIPYPNKKMLHVGYPSNDLLFHIKENECEKIRGIKYSYYILWMPTLRQNSVERNDSDDDLPFGIPLFKTKQDLENINSFCSNQNCLLIIKIHPGQLKDTYKNLSDMSNIAILDGSKVKELNIDNYRLMGSSNALISDFSSSVYSYLLLNRPIGMELSDLKHYKLGYSIENPESFYPGKQIYSVDEFKIFISEVISNKDLYYKKREELLKLIYKDVNGSASRRLAEYLKL